MGFLHQNVCYETTSKALDGYAASVPTGAVPFTTTSAAHQTAKVSGSNVVFTYTLINGTTVYTKTITPVFPSCTYTSITSADAVLISWSVALALIAGASVKLIKNHI